MPGPALRDVGGEIARDQGGAPAPRAPRKAPRLHALNRAAAQSPEVERLTEEIDGLTKETKQLSAVDDFVKLSKLRRTIIKKEKALAALSARPSSRAPRPEHAPR